MSTGLIVASVGAVLTLSIATPAAARSEARTPPTGVVAWTSLGDSFASGEGIARTGGACARSDLAYGPLAATLLAQQRGWTVEAHEFVACTGAVTADLFTSNAEKQLAPQLDAAGRSDVITLSMGGNDIGFADILTTCLQIPEGHLPDTWDEVGRGEVVKLGCTMTREQLNDRIENLTRAHRMPVDGTFTGRTVPRMADVYEQIADEHLTARGVLVVSGYPRIFQPSTDWPSWRGRTCHLMSKQDADVLGAAAERLDETLANEVERADPTGTRIVYQSRLHLFDNDGASHSLCGRPTTEWLNGIAGLSDGSLRKEHSFHPNEPGHAATAEAVATLLDRALGRASPTTTTDAPAPSATDPPATTSPQSTEPADPPIDSGGTFDIGDAFEDTCTIAWPTAPTRLTDSISMTTTCLNVPGQFLFVHVQYGDPDLPVTPSRATMHVKGRIADIAQSEYGFKYLIVIADDVELR
ncbi:MAG: SGNH/GDSL hydrolase family protein [Actinobacteria bacterium]|nr:SGNH/GDSL hydrolase family protein [Actinomycetota bacterium]